MDNLNIFYLIYKYHYYILSYRGNLKMIYNTLYGNIEKKQQKFQSNAKL